MDISLLSLLYAVQNSSKSVPFNTNSGLHVVQKAGICFFSVGIFEFILPGTSLISSCQESGGRMRHTGTTYFLKQCNRMTLGIYKLLFHHTIVFFCCILHVNQLTSFKSALLCSSHWIENGTINRLCTCFIVPVLMDVFTIYVRK